MVDVGALGDSYRRSGQIGEAPAGYSGYERSPDGGMARIGPGTSVAAARCASAEIVAAERQNLQREVGRANDVERAGAKSQPARCEGAREGFR